MTPAASAQPIGIPGITDATPAPEQQVAPVTIPPAPATSYEQAKAQRDSLRQQKREALAGLDLARVAELDTQLDELVESLPEIQRQQVEHHAALGDAWDNSAVRAGVAFPALFEEGSALHAEVARLSAEFERTGDPLANHPDGPMRIAALAAASLGIAPTAKVGGTAPATKPMPVAGNTPRAATPNASPVSPASGASRTSAPAHDAVAREGQAALDRCKDVGELTVLLSNFK